MNSLPVSGGGVRGVWYMGASGGGGGVVVVRITAQQIPEGT